MGSERSDFGDVPNVAMEALRELVYQIERASYFDHYGRLLEATPAFIEARVLVHGYPVAR